MLANATRCAWSNEDSKVEHFVQHARHGEVFGALDADEYEARAIWFLRGPAGPSVLKCTRKTKSGAPGDSLRYDRVTQEFGILGMNGRVRTYFEPKRLVPPNRRGHRCLSNEAYFWLQCKQVF